MGPILLPPRDYDTVHRHRGNLAGIEFRRCLNQTIVGGSTTVDRGGTRSAASSGIGSDSAATPPPYQSHHPLGPRPSRPSRDSSSGKSNVPASTLSFAPPEFLVLHFYRSKFLARSFNPFSSSSNFSPLDPNFCSLSACLLT